MMKKILIIILFLCPADGLWAQSQNHNNQQIIIDLNTGISVKDNSFTTTWNPKPALHLNVRVPFYSSQLEAGARYIRFEGRAPTQTDSDFNSIFLHLGWLYPFKITPAYRIMPAFRFGGNLMVFDEPEVFESGTFRYITDPSEFEFAYEIALRNQLQIANHLYLHATVSYNRTLTNIALPLTLVSGGISFSFSQPQWLKKILQ